MRATYAIVEKQISDHQGTRNSWDVLIDVGSARPQYPEHMLFLPM
jgi:hypothetical protein